MSTLIICIYLLATVMGIMLIKLGSTLFEVELNKTGIYLRLNYKIILGCVMYVVSFLLWIILLKSFDITYIVPLTTGLSQVFLALIGIIIFKESVDVYKILGIIVIGIGTVLININNG